MSTCAATAERSSGILANRLSIEDRAAHDWYRFVLSFPPHLVRDYLDRFGVGTGSVVLDPFCGTGTTLVEAHKRGVPSVGIEAHPMAHFAASTKTDWTPHPGRLLAHAKSLARQALSTLESQGISDEPRLDGKAVKERGRLRTLSGEATELLLTNSISPLPLHKALLLLDCIDQDNKNPYRAHLRLALAKVVVGTSSNLHFGPEVGVLKDPKADAPVVRPWLDAVQTMARDIREIQGGSTGAARVYCNDARSALERLVPGSVDAVICSPPYPNEKDYTRTTRLESVLLGFVQTRNDLRALKGTLVRSNTRGVYKADDDDQWVDGHPEIDRIAKAIEARRIELGKTSGFERLYARVTKLYFGGMVRHLFSLKPCLRPGARLAYVVGDQASYLRVMIRTGQILADLAERAGYRVERIDLFRTRWSTTTRDQLREEVVVLSWPGRGTAKRRGRPAE